MNVENTTFMEYTHVTYKLQDASLMNKVTCPYI